MCPVTFTCLVACWILAGSRGREGACFFSYLGKAPRNAPVELPGAVVYIRLGHGALCRRQQTHWIINQADFHSHVCLCLSASPTTHPSSYSLTCQRPCFTATYTHSYTTYFTPCFVPCNTVISLLKPALSAHITPSLRLTRSSCSSKMTTASKSNSPFSGTASDARPAPLTVLIVGGNRGIGLAFVRQYVELGFNVYATYRKCSVAEASEVCASMLISAILISSSSPPVGLPVCPFVELEKVPRWQPQRPMLGVYKADASPFRLWPCPNDCCHVERSPY